jgi:hypothetical protein
MTTIDKANALLLKIYDDMDTLEGLLDQIDLSIDIGSPNSKELEAYYLHAITSLHQLYKVSIYLHEVKTNGK